MLRIANDTRNAHDLLRSVFRRTPTACASLSLEEIVTAAPTASLFTRIPRFIKIGCHRLGRDLARRRHCGCRRLLLERRSRRRRSSSARAGPARPHREPDGRCPAEAEPIASPSPSTPRRRCRCRVRARRPPRHFRARRGHRSFGARVMPRPRCRPLISAQPRRRRRSGVPRTAPGRAVHHRQHPPALRSAPAASAGLTRAGSPPPYLRYRCGRTRAIARQPISAPVPLRLSGRSAAKPSVYSGHVALASERRVRA